MEYLLPVASSAQHFALARKWKKLNEKSKFVKNCSIWKNFLTHGGSSAVESSAVLKQQPCLTGQ